MPRTSGGHTGLFAVAFSAAEIPIRTMAGSANSSARLRLRVASSVTLMMTPLNRPDIGCPVLLLVLMDQAASR